MDFFERIKNAVTGGGWSSDAERRKREEEERRRKMNASADKAYMAKTKKLDQLYDQNYESTRQEMIKREDAQAAKNPGFLGTDWLAYHLTGKQGLEERAKQAARNKAAALYSEQNDYQPNDVAFNSYQAQTENKFRELRQQNDDVIKNTKTVVDVMRWAPGAGLGELGANALRGNFAGTREADDRILMEQMDLTSSQIAALPQADRDKMLWIAKAGLGAGLLDLAGLGIGGLSKTAGRELGENLAKTTVKKTLKDMLTKQGLKSLAVRTGVSGLAGGAIGYGGSKLMGASDEQAWQNAGSGAMSGIIGSSISAPFDAASDTLVKGGKQTLKNARNVDLSSKAPDIEIENVDALAKDAMPDIVREADVAVAEAENAVEQIPDAIEIETGSGVRSPNLAANAKATAQAALDQARTVRDATVQATKAAPNYNQMLPDANVPTRPVGQSVDEPLPMKPRNIDQNVVDAKTAADAQVNEAAMAAPVRPESPDAQVVETPIESASRNVQTPVGVLPERLPAEDALQLPQNTNVDDAFDRLEDAYAKGEISEAQYQAYDKQLFDKYEKTGDIIAADAGPIKLKSGEQIIEEIDEKGRIRHIIVDKDYEMVRPLTKAEELAYYSPDKVGAADATEFKPSPSTRSEDTIGRRIAEENKKNEANVKITKPATRTVEEGMAALGLPYKPKGAKAAKVAKAPAKVEIPVSDDAKKAQLSVLHDVVETSDSKQERALAQRLIRAIEQGDGTPVKAARLAEATKNFDEFKASPVKPAKAKKYTAKESVDSLFEAGGTKTNPAPVKAEVAAPKKLTAEQLLAKRKSAAKMYNSIGRSYEGDIQPVNSGLRDLEAQFKTPAGKKMAKQELQAKIDSGEVKLNDDGTITVYRGGNMVKENGLVSVSVDKDAAAEFGDVTEMTVNPKDVAAADGLDTGELLVAKKGLTPTGTTPSRAFVSPAKGPATVVDTGATAADNLTKAGTVNKRWIENEIKTIQAGKGSKATKAAKIRDLMNDVAEAEIKASMLKKKMAAPESLRRQQAKPDAAAKQLQKETLVKAKEKQKAEAPSAEYVKVKKAGGKFTDYLAEIDKTITGGATHLDDYKRSLPKKQQMDFDANMKASDATVTAMGDDEALRAVDDLHDASFKENKLGETQPLDTKQTMRLVSLKKRLAYMTDTLVGKKKLTKAEEGRLADIKRAQVKLYEAASSSESEHGRTLGLAGWLYKNLDPMYVSERTIKHMDEAGYPYSAKQEIQVRANNEALQNAHNTFSDTETRLEELKGRLGKGDAETQAATRAELEQVLKDYPEQYKALGDAYDTANNFALDHWDEGVKAGKITQPETFGMGVNRFQKLNMLSGVYGRIRDLATTGTVGVDMLIDDTLGALTGKAVNKIFRTNKFDNSIRGAKGNVKRGWAEGVRKTTGTYSGIEDSHMGLVPEAGGRRGGQTVSNMTDRMLDGTSMNVKRRKPTNNILVKGVRKIGDVIRGNTATPTHIYGEPYRAHRLSIAGMDEARRMGLSDADAQLYARAVEMAPSKEMDASIGYDAREMSGLESKWSKKLDEVHRMALKKFATWDGVKEGNWKFKRGVKQVTGGAITVAKNTIIPFTSWPLGAAQSMITRQNPLFHAWNATVDTVNAIRSGDEAAARSALKNWTKTGYSGAKVAATMVIMAPLLSDTDADGEGYNPPYIKIPLANGGYWSSDLSILGPLSAPLVQAWAAKKAYEAAQDGKPLNEVAGTYAGNLAKGVLSKVGLTTALNGQGIPILNLANDVISSPYRDAESVGKGTAEETTKFVTDVTSQSIPLGSFMRDINATVNSVGGGNLRLTPQTKVYKEDGKTIDWEKTGWNQIMASIPGVNQSMERNTDGKVSQTWDERITGSKSSSPGTVEKLKAEAGKVQQLNESIAPILGDKKYRDLLKDENLKKLYDKAGSKELTSSELAEIRNDIVKTSDKFIENGQYDEYSIIKKIELDKVKADPKSTPAEIKAIEHSIRIGKSLKKHNVKYDLYALYARSTKSQGGKIGGISQDELKKMYDDESEYYDPQTADMLVALDKQLAADGASDNGMDSSKPKYNVDKIMESLARGRGGGKSLNYGAGVTSLGKTVAGEGFSPRSLKLFDSPIPNLAASTARTNLKKAITVQKGVKL